MASNDSVSLAVIALAGTIVTAVVVPLIRLLMANTKAQVRVAETHLQVAGAVIDLKNETKKGNKEAKERNGHLAELVLGQGEQTKALAEGATSQIIEAIKIVKE